MNAKLSWVLLVVGVFAAGSSLQAQQAKKAEKVVEAKPATGRGAATAPDENIKSMHAANDPAAKTPAPPNKGGPRTRGDGCTVHVDNHTPFYISVYLDGEYRGTVGFFGDMYLYVGCGQTRLYARAEYTDGAYSYWGPVVAGVDGTYTWRLWP